MVVTLSHAGKGREEKREGPKGQITKMAGLYGEEPVGERQQKVGCASHIL